MMNYCGNPLYSSALDFRFLETFETCDSNPTVQPGVNITKEYDPNTDVDVMLGIRPRPVETTKNRSGLFYFFSW